MRLIGLLLLAPLGLRAQVAAPRHLSETGLYAHGGGFRVAAANLPFSPQYPLWSDGAAKARWIFLPAGRTVDARDPDFWMFPVGTKFWKEFTFHGRKVETRLIWHSAPASWVFASYAWRPDGSDADLVGPEGLPGAAEVAPGRFHSIPSLQDCASCHDNPKGPVLGFTALQLSTDRDPGAPHAEPLEPGQATLRTLAERRLLSPLHPKFLDEPPRIRAADARTRAVLGYLSANCGVCHQGGNTIPGVHLDLRQPWRILGEPPGLRSTLAQPTRTAVPGQDTRAIAPGAPEASLVLHRMGTRDPLAQMPPLATVLVDEDAVALIRAWIADMAPPKAD